MITAKADVNAGYIDVFVADTDPTRAVAVANATAGSVLRVAKYWPHRFI